MFLNSGDGAPRIKIFAPCVVPKMSKPLAKIFVLKIISKTTIIIIITGKKVYHLIFAPPNAFLSEPPTSKSEPKSSPISFGINLSLFYFNIYIINKFI
jgi:hypothetical protein